MGWFLLWEHGAVADGWWRGTSARARQPLWRCRTESHILPLVKKCRLVPRLACPCANARRAACPPCLSNTPALSLMLHALPSGQGLGRCLPNAYSFSTSFLNTPVSYWFYSPGLANTLNEGTVMPAIKNRWYQSFPSSLQVIRIPLAFEWE